MHEVYLSLGSNQGNRAIFLHQALVLIEKEVGEVVRSSAIYQTASWGREDLPEFLNQVVLIRTALSAEEVLTSILSIEKRLGRERLEKWGARTLDIDILLFDDLIVNNRDLVIPHPLMHERRFVMAPLAEIAPELEHPVLATKIKFLLSQLSDGLFVKPFRSTTMAQGIHKTFEVNLSYLNDIAEGNKEFIIDMIDIFIEQTPVYFNQLATAIYEKDWKTAGDVAHKIKPTLAFIGVDAARDQMIEIERKARSLDKPEEIADLFDDLKDTLDDIYVSLENIKKDLQKQI
ncbi:2-amino-4-hydroxy-6-hydroxymethyldihydropteridine diphosphokinase [Arcticibacter sp. MXS-1]|uniref:2-amino-4-hydroxy-6- hydroxymethyldihydropteridine diphosphokinase n=1 Tax=Arcticibacter sp. MXS-1 TaxID=3341726 RepID=UPI0035A96D86